MEDALVVTGIHAMLFDDDAAAVFVGSDESLVSWSEDSSILMDRYDVRHLIHDKGSLRQRRGQVSGAEEEVSKEELDLERYKDLHEESDKEHTGATSKFSTVPFDYGSGESNGKEEEKKSPPPPLESNKEEPLFVPGFTVPNHLQPHLPTSQKVHQIISGTARFVSERGGQAEVILKVKQADNPKFGFLLPDHVFHPYFRYLVDYPELTGARSSPQPPPPPPPPRVGSASLTKPAEGLRLLGEIYGEDDEDSDKAGTLPLTVDIRTIKEPPPQMKTVMEKMVEFMVRNGKDFEDVVREKDKSDERFHFLHPWHEYHPYYLRMLQNADQANSRRRSSSSRYTRTSKAATTKAGSCSSQGAQEANGRESKAGRVRSTRFDVPPKGLQKGDEVRTVPQAQDSSVDVPNEIEFMKDIVSSGGGADEKEQVGMSYDAALAAVLAATRGIQKPKVTVDESNKQPAKTDIKAERLKRAKMLLKGGTNEASAEEAGGTKTDRISDIQSKDKNERESARDTKQHAHDDRHSRKRKHHQSRQSDEQEQHKVEVVSDDIRAKVRAMLQQL